MIKYDAAHPSGIKISPIKPEGVELAPVMVRQMTAEEREQYGQPEKRRHGETVCPWTKRLASKDFGEV